MAHHVELSTFLKILSKKTGELIMNKSGDENRSVRNTKKRLREGLIQLMWEKPVNEISVRELTFIINGCVGLIQTWLDNGLRESPEEISRLAGTIIVASLKPCIS